MWFEFFLNGPLLQSNESLIYLHQQIENSFILKLEVAAFKHTLSCVCLCVFLLHGPVLSFPACFSSNRAVTWAMTSGCTRHSSRSFVVIVLVPGSLCASAKFSHVPSAQSCDWNEHWLPSWRAVTARPRSGLISCDCSRGQRTGVRWGPKGRVKEPQSSRVCPLESCLTGRRCLVLWVWTFWNAPTARLR